MGKFAALALFTFAVAASAEPVKVQWLTTPAQIQAEYCRTDFPLTSENCSVTGAPQVALVFMPDRVHNAVMGHLESALQARYYDTLSMDDLFHGHLLLKGPQVDYASPEELAADVQMILYHSAEYNQRWENEWELDIVNRRVRSFIGSVTSPLVQPAVDLLPQVPRSYERSGTIYAGEVAAAHPEISQHEWGQFGGEPELRLTLCRDGECRACHASSQMYVMPGPEGVQTYIRCEFVPEGVLRSRRSVPRKPPPST